MKKMKFLLTVSLMSVSFMALSSNVFAEDSTLSTSETLTAETSLSDNNRTEEAVAFDNNETTSINQDLMQTNKMVLNMYLNANYINQTQYDDTLLKLNNASTDEEVTQIITDLESNLGSDALTYRSAFAESYINIKANIDTLAKNGTITKEQQEDFLKQLDACKTKDELDALWTKINASTNATEESTGNTSSTDSNTSSTIDSSSAKPSSPSSTSSDTSNKKNSLPQTGESIQKALPIVGVLILLGASAWYYKTKKK